MYIKSCINVWMLHLYKVSHTYLKLGEGEGAKLGEKGAKLGEGKELS